MFLSLLLCFIIGTRQSVHVLLDNALLTIKQEITSMIIIIIIIFTFHLHHYLVMLFK